MAPSHHNCNCNIQAVTSLEAIPSSPNLVPALQLTDLKASTSQDSSHPDNVPDNNKGAHSNSDFDIEANDLDAINMPKDGPSKILYFYKKTKEFCICKICR
jgi:hypothetical protein